MTIQVKGKTTGLYRDPNIMNIMGLAGLAAQARPPLRCGQPRRASARARPRPHLHRVADGRIPPAHCRARWQRRWLPAPPLPRGNGPAQRRRRVAVNVDLQPLPARVEDAANMGYFEAAVPVGRLSGGFTLINGTLNVSASLPSAPDPPAGRPRGAPCRRGCAASAPRAGRPC